MRSSAHAHFRGFASWERNRSPDIMETLMDPRWLLDPNPTWYFLSRGEEPGSTCLKCLEFHCSFRLFDVAAYQSLHFCFVQEWTNFLFLVECHSSHSSTWWNTSIAAFNVILSWGCTVENLCFQWKWSQHIHGYTMAPSVEFIKLTWLTLYN